MFLMKTCLVLGFFCHKLESRSHKLEGAGGEHSSKCCPK